MSPANQQPPQPPTPAASHRLGLGTAALGSRIGRGASLRLLNTAFDAGIRYFDTAPPYGQGEAESILGEFLQGKREAVHLVTKFGLEPPRRSWLRSAAKPLARGVLQLAPALRGSVARAAGAPRAATALDAALLERSLQRSLAALQTPFVDTLLLHEMSLEAVTPALCAALAAVQQTGRVRRFGVALQESQELSPKAALHAPGQVLQGTDAALRRLLPLPADVRQKIVITHSVLRNTLAPLTRRLATEPGLAARLRRELDIDPHDRRRLGRLALAAALRRNGGGVVLFASLDPETIRQNARLQGGAEFSAEQIERFEDYFEGPLEGAF